MINQTITKMTKLSSKLCFMLSSELPKPKLTDREKEWLKEATDGKVGKEIADSMGISTHTENSHSRNVLTKLHVRSKLEAVVKALTTTGIL